jgi:hypothetical protein
MDYAEILSLVKQNAVIEHDEDDSLITQYIKAAVDYAEYFQSVDYSADGVVLPPATLQAVVLMATQSYNSRDGATGGFFADTSTAAVQARIAVDRLLMPSKEWNV